MLLPKRRLNSRGTIIILSLTLVVVIWIKIHLLQVLKILSFRVIAWSIIRSRYFIGLRRMPILFLRRERSGLLILWELGNIVKNHLCWIHLRLSKRIHIRSRCMSYRINLALMSGLEVLIRLWPPIWCHSIFSLSFLNFIWRKMLVWRLALAKLMLWYEGTLI